MNKSSGTHSHSSNTDEQDVVELALADNTIIWGMWLDMTNLAQDHTIRYKYQIDGSNYRTFQTTSWDATMIDGLKLADGLFAVGNNLKVTLDSTVAEGSALDVPYVLYYHTITSIPLVSSSGTYVVPHTVSTEATILELSPATNKYNVHWGIWLDVYNVTHPATIREYHKIDDTNYRCYKETAYGGVGNNYGILLTGNFSSDQDIKVTFQPTAELINRNVPYEWFYYTQEEPSYYTLVNRSDHVIRTYVRSGSTSYIDFQLAVDGDPIDLTYMDHIKLIRQDNRNSVLTDTSDSGDLEIIDAENGMVRFTLASGDFDDYRSPYRGWFWVYPTSSTRYAVPDNGEIIFHTRSI